MAEKCLMLNLSINTDVVIRDLSTFGGNVMKLKWGGKFSTISSIAVLVGTVISSLLLIRLTLVIWNLF